MAMLKSLIHLLNMVDLSIAMLVYQRVKPIEIMGVPYSCETKAISFCCDLEKIMTMMRQNRRSSGVFPVFSPDQISLMVPQVETCFVSPDSTSGQIMATSMSFKPWFTFCSENHLK